MNDENEDFSQVYATHVTGLYNYGIGLGFSHDICLDAIHDVFFKFYTKDKLENVGNIKYYLFRSIKNRLIDIRRSKKKEVANQYIGDLPFTVEVTVMDSLIKEEERALLKKKVESLMNSLTQRQREAIFLRYMEEMEYDEIGELLHMNSESVRKLVYRGIEKIRKESGNIPTLFCILYLTGI